MQMIKHNPTSLFPGAQSGAVAGKVRSPGGGYRPAVIRRRNRHRVVGRVAAGVFGQPHRQP
jgi:hypothetical protein